MYFTQGCAICQTFRLCAVKRQAATRAAADTSRHLHTPQSRLDQPCMEVEASQGLSVHLLQGRRACLHKSLGYHGVRLRRLPLRSPDDLLLRRPQQRSGVHQHLPPLRSRCTWPSPATGHHPHHAARRQPPQPRPPGRGSGVCHSTQARHQLHHRLCHQPRYGMLPPPAAPRPHPRSLLSGSHLC